MDAEFNRFSRFSPVLFRDLPLVQHDVVDSRGPQTFKSLVDVGEDLGRGQIGRLAQAKPFIENRRLFDQVRKLGRGAFQDLAAQDAPFPIAVQDRKENRSGQEHERGAGWGLGAGGGLPWSPDETKFRMTSDGVLPALRQ